MIKSFNLGLLFTTGYQTLFTVTPTSHNTSRVVDINRSEDQFWSVYVSFKISRYLSFLPAVYHTEMRGRKLTTVLIFKWYHNCFNNKAGCVVMVRSQDMFPVYITHNHIEWYCSAVWVTARFLLTCSTEHTSSRLTDQPAPRTSSVAKHNLSSVWLSGNYKHIEKPIS